MNRMLPRNGEYKTWANSLNRILGTTSWQTEFYKEDPQIGLFNNLSDMNGIGESQQSRKIKDANPERIKNYIVERLQTIFPCVSKNPRIFKNTKNSPIFLFCFAISNSNENAKGIALRIADHILKNR